MAIKLKILSGDYSAEVEAGKTATLNTSLKYLANDVVFEAVDNTVTLISFTIAGVTYQAVDGMNWLEWCDNATYNTGGYEVFNYSIQTSDGAYYVINEANEPVQPSYLIRANGSYLLSAGGSN